MDTERTVLDVYRVSHPGRRPAQNNESAIQRPDVDILIENHRHGVIDEQVRIRRRRISDYRKRAVYHFNGNSITADSPAVGGDKNRKIQGIDVGIFGCEGELSQTAAEITELGRWRLLVPLGTDEVFIRITRKYRAESSLSLHNLQSRAWNGECGSPIGHDDEAGSVVAGLITDDKIDVKRASVGVNRQP